MPPVDPTTVRRWAPAAVAVVAFAGVAGWGAIERSRDDEAGAANASTVVSTFSSPPPETTAGASSTTLVKRPLAPGAGRGGVR